MTKDSWNYVSSLCLSVWFGLIFFAKKQSGSPHACTSLPPHYRASLVAQQPTQGPSLSRAHTWCHALKTLHHVQHETPHFCFSLSPKLCQWSCPHRPISGSPGPPNSELWSPWKRFMAEADASKRWQGCGLFLKVKVLVTQSCPALCDPMDCSRPSSSVHGILQARIPECCCCC